MGLQEHDLIMADEKFSRKNRLKNDLPALVGQNGLHRWVSTTKDSEKSNEFEKFRRSGTLRNEQLIVVVT